ncbi:hypothetical protein SV7mr_48590 [Stieleria bergensis]|uniref:Uncharacterized protein n=1 Tax=Stieleria bergensis TaxID=2528025 RepID=A0A517T1R9_9BACT|nr:hypothetical protein SV7mr_48590 [Planctomycetes bacterium SV_7m_r]
MAMNFHLADRGMLILRPKIVSEREKFGARRSLEM